VSNLIDWFLEVIPHLISWVVRIIPEAFIIILAGYAFSKRKLEVIPYIRSSIILATSTFIIGLLPATKVMQMVLSAIVAVVVIVLVNNLKPVKAIFSTLVCLALTISYELLNILLLQMVFGLDTYKIFNESGPLVKNISGLPSYILFASTVIIIYFKISKKEIRE
jgi:hypothetical protein